MRAHPPGLRPTWAEVDLGALRRNLRAFRSRLGPAVKILFVVKADAYGHGAAACARAAQSSGLCDWLGVSSVEEGAALREKGVRLPVLVLGSLYPFESFAVAARYGLTATVASLSAAKSLASAARRRGRRVSCHLKIETGMGRIGMRPPAAAQAAEHLERACPGALTGLYTHLSSPEESPSYTRRQLAEFSRAVAAVSSRARGPLLRHAAASAAALRYPESRWDMARPGLAVYGLYPGFEPVLTLKTRVVFLKTVPRGTAVGYGASYRTRLRSRLATLPVGYADGFLRALSNRGSVLVRGRRCPVVGRISMDMATIDVTRVPGARVGDEAVVFGRQGAREIPIRSAAALAGAIPYEIPCGLTARVPRIYLS
ncbi:MAG: alanine racemase [Elusimicrobia bacterium]|nr:alanine racemase [Elusimicrobiota bacterium]MDE2314360.1 alanine racemase [Elusimicrobiota bacterium]